MSGFVVKEGEGGGGPGAGDVERGLGGKAAMFEAQLAAMDEEALRAALVALPLPVQKRIRALKKLQVATIEHEKDFYRRIHQLELEFAPKFQTLFTKRRDIVLGKAEPTDDDADYPLIGGLGSLEKEMEEKASLTNGGGAGEEEGAAPDGIPEFWLHTLRNVDMIGDMISEQDEPILAKLSDVELEFSEEKDLFFSIHFRFAENEFFANQTLSKTYRMKCEVDPDAPFEFDGPEIVLCTGTKIEWKSKEKNVTVKTVKKKQKHKSKASTRWVTKEVKADSFFNFFDPPSEEEQKNLDELDEDTRDLLNADFEIGQVLRDRVIPRAVLYFTGEAQDDDEDYEDEDAEDDDEDSDEDDDDDLPDGKSHSK